MNALRSITCVDMAVPPFSRVRGNDASAWMTESVSDTYYFYTNRLNRWSQSLYKFSLNSGLRSRWSAAPLIGHRKLRQSNIHARASDELHSRRQTFRLLGDRRAFQPMTPSIQR